MNSETFSTFIAITCAASILDDKLINNVIILRNDADCSFTQVNLWKLIILGQFVRTIRIICV